MEYDIKYLQLQSIYRNLNSLNSHCFPKEWYNVKEYELKKKILNDCITNNILIVNSIYYYEFKKRALGKKNIDI